MMEVKNQSKLRFHGVDIIKVDFTSLKAVEGGKVDLDLDTDVKIFYPQDKPNIFNILMDVNLTASEYFNLSLLAFGTFEIVSTEEITDEIRKAMTNINCPAIMFPYVRSFISTFTSNLGSVTGTITIPIKFFRGELPELELGDDDLPLPTKELE